MTSFRLQIFFYELIRLACRFPGKHTGNACEGLIEQMCLYQPMFIKIITEDYTGDVHEFRLNNVGLKMLWSVDRTNKKFPKLGIKICGDQATDYPEFIEKAEALIKRFGFDR
jgi:hypothetical protein